MASFRRTLLIWPIGVGELLQKVYTFFGGGGAYLILLHCFGPLRTDDGSYTPYKPSALLTARILGTYEACISLLHQGTVSRIFKAFSYWLGRPRYSR